MAFTIYENIFSTPEIRYVFSDQNYIQKLLDAEAALGWACAKVGIITQAQARIVQESCHACLVNTATIKSSFEKNGGHIIMALLSQVKVHSEEASKYIHWGATSQDIIDTGAILQIREAYDTIYRDTKRLKSSLIDISEQHKDTEMAGRTHSQHAIPTSFGFKMATIACEVDRHIKRLEQLAPTLFVGSLFGAVGTLAAFGEKRYELQKYYMEHLNLNIPKVSWHTNRDNLAEFVTTLGMITATTSKLGWEVTNLMRTEIDEVAESFLLGKIGSSTMPQKRNPVQAETLIAIERLMRGNVSLFIETMIQQHERDLGAWLPEWVAMPRACELSAKALESACDLIENLEVKTEKMKSNIMLTHGLIYSESVLISLAKKHGKHKAHEIVYQACMKSIKEKISLNEALNQELGMNVDIIELSNSIPYLESAINATEHSLSLIKKK